MKILGLDPGIASFGWAIIETGVKSGLKLECCGVIKTPAGQNLGERLSIIGGDLKQIIAENHPSYAAVEEIFFSKNVKTATVVGHARGAAILVCAEAGLKIAEYTPLEVKKALTGYGHADKNQIGYMVQRVMKLKVLPKDDNTVDAIAIAVCFAHSCRE